MRPYLIFAQVEEVIQVRAIKRLRPELSVTEFFVFLFPLLVFVTILYGMLGWTFYSSVSNWQGTAPNYEFAGLKWYEMMFGMDRFWVDLENNLTWLILGVIPTVIIGLFLAYLLEIGSIPGAESYVRTLILYPMAMSFIVTGTIWSWMYQPDKGVFNTILNGLGLKALTSGYITHPPTATYWLILIFMWQYLGFSVIILQSSFRTAELQEMVEAATVDGASRLRILLQIIIPNIRGGILILVSLLLISTLKVFDIVYIVTFGGPGYSTDVLALFMFIATFQQHLVALGAGLGVMIFLLAFIIIIPYTIYSLQRWFE
jgi:raffinose/stachyose/melibiose transport system permease protein